MKRASYRAGVDWIARNDSAGDSDALDPRVASELITSAFLADLFNVEADRIGRDVVRTRKRLDKAGGG